MAPFRRSSPPDKAKLLTRTQCFSCEHYPIVSALHGVWGRFVSSITQDIAPLSFRIFLEPKDYKKMTAPVGSRDSGRGDYCRSYSPLPRRFRTVNPAFLASEIDCTLGELNEEKTFRTGFLQAGQFV